MYKSLLTLTAKTPNKKNNKAGFFKFSINKSKFIVIFFVVALVKRSFSNS